jgi:hypothetical protein
MIALVAKDFICRVIDNSNRQLIPLQTGNSFLFKPATHSSSNRQLIPLQTGNSFLFKPATHSSSNRSRAKRPQTKRKSAIIHETPIT